MLSNIADGSAAARTFTESLFAGRTSRRPNRKAENEALLALATCLADSAATVLTEMCNLTLRLCHCETAGVSLLEYDDAGNEVFCWAAIVGAWQPYVGGVMPRNASPCGLVVDSRSTLIFRDVERVFPAVMRASPPIAELLLVPFYVGGNPVGTVWAITHHADRQFDREDERLLKSLASFASPASQFSKAQIALQSANAARDAADAATAATELRWERLFQELSEGFVLGELIRDDLGRAVDWRYLQINNAWTRMLNFPAGQVIGRTVRDVFPNIEEEWIDDFARAVDTGQPVRFTRHVGMVQRWYDGIAQPAGEDRFTVLFIDVTERVRESRRQSALIALGDMLRDGIDEEFLIQYAARIIGEAMGAQRACYGELDESQETVSFGSNWCVPKMQSIEGAHRFSSYGPIREDIVRGGSLLIDDVQSDPRTSEDNACWAELNVRAAACVPVKDRERIVSLVVVHFEQPHAWTDGELAFLRSAADRLEIAIAQKRAAKLQSTINDEKRESEERFRQFAENSRSVLWIIDLAKMKVEYLSPAFDAIWGETIETTLGRHGDRFFHPDDRQRMFDALDRVRLGEAFTEEFRIIRPDRAVRWIRSTFFSIRDAHGRIRCAGGVAEDITCHDERFAYVVDADVISRQDLTRALRDAGYNVRAFQSGKAFLEAAPALAAGCVVLDTRQPKAGGLTIPRELKTRRIGLPVIVLGEVQSDVKSAVQVMKAGAVDFLPIPYDPDELLTALASAVADITQVDAQDKDAARARESIAGMTVREREILDGLLAGQTNKQIARAIGLSPRTVETHRAHVMQRLGARTIPELVRIAALAGVNAPRG